jgi:hypothetical protein
VLVADGMQDVTHGSAPANAQSSQTCGAGCAGLL